MNDKHTPEQIAAKEKAVAVIESCTTCEHFTNAELFLDLFYKSFNDKDEYDVLFTLFKDKKLELNCHE